MHALQLVYATSLGIYPVIPNSYLLFASLSMQDSEPLKQAFLENLILRLKQGGVAKDKGMSFLERKNAIKLAADVALASARGGTQYWSRSLASDLSLSRRAERKGVHHRATSPPLALKWKAARSNKILRKNFRARSPRPVRKAARARAVILARAMVKKRTRVLKEIIPGGKRLDECSLLGETLDYAVSLRAQVDAMQLLVRALQVPKPYEGGFKED